MKKVILSGLVIVLGGIGMFSCKKEVKVKQSAIDLKSVTTKSISNLCDFNFTDYALNTPDQKICQFKQIGETHNEGLNYVYEYILTKNLTNKSRSQILNFAKQGAVNFGNQNINGSRYNLFHQFTQDVFNSQDLVGFSNSYLSNQQLTSEQFSYINAVETYVNQLSLSNDLKLFNSQILTLEYDLISKLSDDKEIVLLSYTATVRASISYWTENGQDWVDNIPYAKKPSYWGNVGKEDGKGAACGAGWFGGAAIFGGPIGWGAFLGCCAGGAASLSIYAMF